jgi:hypothetical protein
VDLARQAARRELDNEPWLRAAARPGGRSVEEMRVVVLEFLDADLLHVSADHCATFLDPLIESWDVDLGTFRLDVVLDEALAGVRVKRFEFLERDAAEPGSDAAGFREFLDSPALSGTANDAELAWLRRLRFSDRHPTALYYYRELQSLRDPLHFRA